MSFPPSQPRISLFTSNSFNNNNVNIYFCMNVCTTQTTSSDKIDLNDVNYFGLVVTKLLCCYRCYFTSSGFPSAKTLFSQNTVNLSCFQCIYPTNITDFEHSIVSSLFFEQMPFSPCWALAKIIVQGVQKIKVDIISLYTITQLRDYKSNGVKFRTTRIFLCMLCFCFAFTMWSTVATSLLCPSDLGSLYECTSVLILEHCATEKSECPRGRHRGREVGG